jgi:PPM family protein phosphatase
MPAELRLRYAARSAGGQIGRSSNDWVYAGARLLGEVAAQPVITALANLDEQPDDDLLSKLQAAVVDGNAAMAEVEPDPRT